MLKEASQRLPLKESFAKQGSSRWYPRCREPTRSFAFAGSCTCYSQSVMSQHIVGGWGGCSFRWRIIAVDVLAVIWWFEGHGVTYLDAATRLLALKGSAEGNRPTFVAGCRSYARNFACTLAAVLCMRVPAFIRQLVFPPMAGPKLKATTDNKRYQTQAPKKTLPSAAAAHQEIKNQDGRVLGGLYLSHRLVTEAPFGCESAKGGIVASTLKANRRTLNAFGFVILYF